MNRTHAEKSGRPFKCCSMCQRKWETKEDFLSDPHVKLDGYQWNRKVALVRYPAGGLLIFTHLCDDCGTSLGIAASDFKDAVPGL